MTNSYERYTEEEEKQIEKLFLKGSTDKEIATLLGRSTDAINHKRQLLNVHREIEKYPITQELSIIKDMLLVPDPCKDIITSMLQRIYVRGKMDGMKEAEKMFKFQDNAITLNRSHASTTGR